VDALIFAAGLGTRLLPLTATRPKAAVAVAGIPVIARVAARLVAAGADRLVVNTHAFPEQVRAALESHPPGVEVVYSHEPDRPLETGGGLLHAAALLRGDAPFFLHNSDVLSDLPLDALYQRHVTGDALCTVAVHDRQTSRRLLFDDAGLCGREDAAAGTRTLARTPAGPVTALAFTGIHVGDPALPARLRPRPGPFSILDGYLELVSEGERVMPFRADGWHWLDIGSAERLRDAERIYGVP
jgi:N-acetyl-alpha-D-muramate 1-phosphate uridylyltransferase